MCVLQNQPQSPTGNGAGLQSRRLRKPTCMPKYKDEGSENDEVDEKEAVCGSPEYNPDADADQDSSGDAEEEAEAKEGCQVGFLDTPRGCSRFPSLAGVCPHFSWSQGVSWAFGLRCVCVQTAFVGRQ